MPARPDTSGGIAMDALLSLDVYAVACWGLATPRWRVLDEHTADVISACGERDPVRSLQASMMMLAAILGGGGLMAVVHLGAGTTALVFSVWVMIGCIAGVLVLAPVVLFRTRPAVVLRSHAEGRELLRIECRTRLGIARVRYDVIGVDGRELGRIFSLRRLRLGPNWRIEQVDGEPITLAAPLRSALPIGRALGRLRASVRRLRGRDPWGGPSLVARTAGGGQIAHCLCDPASDWTWVMLHEAGPPLRPLILAACMLAMTDAG